MTLPLLKSHLITALNRAQDQVCKIAQSKQVRVAVSAIGLLCLSSAIANAQVYHPKQIQQPTAAKYINGPANGSAGHSITQAAKAKTGEMPRRSNSIAHPVNPLRPVPQPTQSQPQPTPTQRQNVEADSMVRQASAMQSGERQRSSVLQNKESWQQRRHVQHRKAGHRNIDLSPPNATNQVDPINDPFGDSRPTQQNHSGYQKYVFQDSADELDKPEEPETKEGDGEDKEEGGDKEEAGGEELPERTPDRKYRPDCATVNMQHISAIHLNLFPAGAAPADCPMLQSGVTRCWNEQTFTFTASALCHKPLYFEDVQLERYGHSIGPILQPFKSTVHFFARLGMLPYQTGVHPPNECQYALGYYRPGDCAPWLQDPFPISRRGMLRQAGFAVGAAYLFP